MKLVVRGGRAVSPVQKLDAIVDLHVVDGVVEAIERSGGPAPSGFDVIDAAGCAVLPGLVDLACHAREPGREDEEDLATTLRAAARGGFTTVLALPDTDPPTDGADDVRHRLARAQGGDARLLVAGCLTKRRLGLELADIGEMALAGAAAFTDAPDAVLDGEVLRRAMEYAASFDALVIAAGSEPSLSKQGVVAEGAVATRLGLAGIPAAAETIALFRHVELARLTGARVHLGPISTARGLAVVEAARADGMHVTAEVHPWSLILDEELHLARPYDTALRLAPPLRTAADRAALTDAVRRGVLVVSSGHAPSSPRFKQVELALAEAGGATLPCVLPMLLGHDGLTAAQLVRACGEGPAQVLRLADAGRIHVGGPADLVVVQEGAVDTVDDAWVGTTSPRGPFTGMTTSARVTTTILAGRVVHAAGAAR